MEIQVRVPNGNFKKSFSRRKHTSLRSEFTGFAISDGLRPGEAAVAADVVRRYGNEKKLLCIDSVIFVFGLVRLIEHRLKFDLIYIV
jgi:hypothetical protein